MEFEDIYTLIFGEIKPKLENNTGLWIFARERAKFEGWLKVELCNILAQHFSDVVPEKDRIDVTFSNWAIELKTINTNIRYSNVENKHRPITKNVQGVIDDINKLKSANQTNRAVLFVVFPITIDNKKWEAQLQRISGLLKHIKRDSFKFRGKIPGVLYFGLV